LLNSNADGWLLYKEIASLLSVNLSHDFCLTIHVSLPYMAAGTAVILYNFSYYSNLTFPFMALLIVPTRII